MVYYVIYMTLAAIIDIATQASLTNVVELRKYILTCVPTRY